MKIKKKIKKLVEIINEQKITNTDIYNLCKTDDAFAEDVCLLRSIFEPMWTINSQYPQIQCSTEGDIKISGTQFIPLERDGILKIILANGKKSLSAALLILGCFEKCPGKMKHYTVGYRDGNYRNIKLSNLYWKKVL